MFIPNSMTQRIIDRQSDLNLERPQPAVLLPMCLSLVLGKVPQKCIRLGSLSTIMRGLMLEYNPPRPSASQPCTSEFLELEPA